MSRFLFVTLPMAGHAYPASGVAGALAHRGNDVAWVGSEKRLRPMLGEDAVIYPTGMRPFRGLSDSGLAAVKSLWEFVIPFARSILPGVEKAIDEFHPDALVVDQHAMAGALAGIGRGLPWATLCPSCMELTHPFRDRLPRVEAWIHEQMAGLWEWSGLPGEAPDLRFSPHLLLAATGPALLGDMTFPGHWAFVGPPLWERPAAEGAGPLMEWLDPARQHVLITVGTLFAEVARAPGGFYHRALEAVAPLAGRLQAIIIAPPDALPDPPANVMVASRVPVLSLLPHIDALVCHGGLNIVCETLAHGVPMVVAPGNRDQPILAEQVAAAGAGIRVSFARARADQLRAALLAVLDEPSYRAAARAVRDSFKAAGGAPAAAALLERLAAG